jgi:hypothetical protein
MALDPRLGEVDGFQVTVGAIERNVDTRPVIAVNDLDAIEELDSAVASITGQSNI